MRKKEEDHIHMTTMEEKRCLHLWGKKKEEEEEENEAMVMMLKRKEKYVFLLLHGAKWDRQSRSEEKREVVWMNSHRQRRRRGEIETNEHTPLVESSEPCGYGASHFVPPHIPPPSFPIHISRPFRKHKLTHTLVCSLDRSIIWTRVLES